MRIDIRKIKIILFLLVNSQMITSVSADTWKMDKTFDDARSSISFILAFDGLGNNVIRTFIENSSGNYIVAANSLAYQDTDDFFICSMNPFGEIHWMKNYHLLFIDKISGLTERSSGGYYASGLVCQDGSDESNFILRLDQNGSVEWARRVFSGRAYYPADCLETSEGGVISFSNSQLGDESCPVLSKFDDAGTHLWTRYYQGDGFLWIDYLSQAIPTQDGNFVIIGNGRGDDFYNAFVLKIDGDGVPLWCTTFQIPIFTSMELYSICEAYDGSLLMSATGNPYSGSNDMLVILRMDNTGQVVWMRCVYQDNVNFYNQGIAAHEDGGFLISGVNLGYEPRHEFTIFRFNANGESESSVYYYGSGGPDPGKTINTVDGGFLIAGAANGVSICKTLPDGSLVDCPHFTPIAPSNEPLSFSQAYVTTNVVDGNPTIIPLTPEVIEVTPTCGFICEPMEGTPIPPTATPSQTPEPTATHPENSATPSPIQTTTATPCLDPGLVLNLNTCHPVAGDLFHLSYTLHAGESASILADSWILLDVLGSYFCYPSWINLNDGVDYKPSIFVEPGVPYHEDVLIFSWPLDSGSASGLRFWGAALDSSSKALIGEIDSIDWSYG